MAAPKRPFICECNEPAYRKKHGHEPICPRCDRIEQAYGMRDRKPKNIFRSLHPKDPVSRWVMFDSDPVLLPDALARVQAVLDRAASVGVEPHPGLS